VQNSKKSTHDDYGVDKKTIKRQSQKNKHLKIYSSLLPNQVNKFHFEN
jgi:hypothetical protein